MSDQETILWRFVATGHKEVEQAFKGVTAAAQASGRATVASHRGAATAARKASADSLSARERAERSWGNVAIRETERVSKATQKAEAQRWREVERTGKKIEAQFAKEAKAAEQAAIRQRRASDKFRDADVKRLGRMGDRVGGVMSSVAATGGLVAAGLVGAAARDSIKLGEVANRISISSQAAGGAALDPAQLKKTFENVAIATPGISATSVGEAAQTFQSRTGKVLGGEHLQTLATAASASGAEITDLSDAMAALSMHLDINSIEDMQTALSDLISQGARGSFELKDAAANYRELASAAGMFGIGKGTEAVKTLGGMTQIAMSSSGSADEASTALRNLFLKLGTEGQNLKTKFGVNVLDKDNKPRNVNDVLLETIAKVGGNDPLKKNKGLTELFDVRALKAIAPLIAAYNDAVREGKDGMVAMRAKVEDAAATSGTWADRQREAAQAQTSSSAQLSSAWESLKVAVGERLVPAFIPIIEALPGLVPVIEPLIGAFGVLLDAILDFAKSIPGVDTEAIERIQRKRGVSKELEALNAALPKDFVGPLSEEQQAMADRRAQLMVEQSAMKSADAEAAMRKAGGPASADNTMLAKGALVGGAAGALVGGKPGAVVGAALGTAAASSGVQQGKDYAAQRSQGFIETQSGSILPVPEIKTDKATQQVQTFGDAVAAAMAKIQAASQASVFSGG